MAALDVLKLLLFGGDKTWVILNQDTQEQVRGDFPPQNVVENLEAEWAETSPIGRAQPGLQFVRGKADTMSFTVRTFARDALSDVAEQHEAIKSFVRIDEDLGRPPICLFLWGTEIGMQCVVTSVGGIQYDEIRGEGTPRGAVFNISLKRYEPLEIEESDPLAPVHFSRIEGMKTGDVYESVARRAFGDAMKGVWLRQIHASDPNDLNEKSGTRVTTVDEAVISDDERTFLHIPRRAVVSDLRVQPESFLFLNLADPDSAQSLLMQEAFTDRSDAAVISL